MRTEPVGIKFQDLGNPAFSIPTPDHHISLCNICLCVAKKQSGKTYFLSNLLYQLQEANSIHRIFILSDTFNSNKKMMENLNIRPEDVISPNDENAINYIIDEINNERDLILEYREKLKIYDELKKLYKYPSKLPGELHHLFQEYIDTVKMNFVKPEHWNNGKKPSIALMCDDIQSTSLIGSKAFKNLCIKCRHVGSFEDGEPPIGCSIFIAVQNYTASGNEGIPKSCRGNINTCAIWRTGNMKELDLWATEMSGVIPKQRLLDAYNHVMDKDPDNRHNFLFVDLTPKKCHPSPFRMNYTDWILE